MAGLIILPTKHPPPTQPGTPHPWTSFTDLYTPLPPHLTSPPIREGAWTPARLLGAWEQVLSHSGPRCLIWRRWKIIFMAFQTKKDELGRGQEKRGREECTRGRLFPESLAQKELRALTRSPLIQSGSGTLKNVGHPFQFIILRPAF